MSEEKGFIDTLGKPWAAIGFNVAETLQKSAPGLLRQEEIP